MSMLAERKRKQKWSLNPRGKEWAEDTNKFGQKLMEKMGWKHGKGLGARENGIIEHIRVSYKNDSRGMGFVEQTEQWTEHQENFSKLLENLKQGDDDQDNTESKIKSLEEKSLKSRARVHYHKFTRGKDLSRYSKKDLANILGKKSFEEPVKEETIKIKEEIDENKSFGVETITGGSMVDYFKKRIPNFSMNSNYNIGSNGVLKSTEPSDSETERPSFGFGFSQNHAESDDEKKHVVKEEFPKKKKSVKSTFVSFVKEIDVTDTTAKLEVVNNSDESIEKKQKKKKNKQKSNLEDSNDKVKSSFVSYLQEDVSTCEDKDKKSKKRKSLVSVEETETKKRKLEPQTDENELKSKKTKKKKKDVELGISNPAFDPMKSNVVIEKHVLNPINEIEVEEHLFDENEVEDSKKENLDNQQSSMVEGRKKCKKSKNKMKDDAGISNPVFDQMKNNVENVLKPINEIGVEERSFNKNETESSKNENLDNQQSSTVESRKKSKKSKNKSKNDAGISNPAFAETNNNTIGEIDETYNIVQSESLEDVNGDNKKEKKRKKRKLNGFTNPDFDVENVDTTSNNEIISKNIIEENPYEVKINKKKKRKEYTETSYAMDNPNFDLNTSIETKIENDNFEVVRKEKKKKKHKENKIEKNDKLEEIPKTDDIECDIILNVGTTPISTPKVESILTPKVGFKRRKSVRFSDVTHERIIPSNEDYQKIQTDYNKKDLYDINTKIIVSSLEEQAKKDGNNGVVNPGFDLKSIDKISFYEKPRKKGGLDNAAFNKNAVAIEENMIGISKTLENYQAEIENDLNEAKDGEKVTDQEENELVIGRLGPSCIVNQKTEEGVMLAFKEKKFQRSPRWEAALTGAKKSYKHLIKGDVLIGFKNCNLHTITGYGIDICKKNK